MHAARVMIPGAYEPDAPLHRDPPATHSIPTTPLGGRRPHTAVAATPYVVDAPARSTTLLGHAAGVLGDLGLIAAVLFVAAAAPTLVVWGIYLAGALIVDMWRQ